MYGSISAVGGRVDADRPRCHLRDGNDVGKLGRAEPMMSKDGLGLYQRQHSVSSTESEESDDEEGVEEF